MDNKMDVSMEQNRTLEGTVYPLLDFRAMFYLVLPSETVYRTLKDVPNFVDKSLPYFFGLFVVEAIILRLKGKQGPRLNDSINSSSHGVLSLLHTLLWRSVELLIYCWIYENYNILKLPWDSAITWGVAFICVDFCYYWFHRWSHECNIIWASHQVHHSSEDYNLSTALRQSVWQKYYSMFVYFPLALFLPPQAMYTHQQFNLLYQFWIHTELVGNLGPLEYILNTASHHRVHHGRNPYCIDKNYAGVLIIWDRMFNTFAKEDEKVIYGLVHPNTFWDPIRGQLFHYLYVLGLVRKYDRLSDKISAVVKGPGWQPGTPWTGNPEDLPEVKEPVKKYDSNVPMWANVYICVHFFLTLAFYSALIPHKQHFNAATSLACVAFIVFSLQSFAALFDHRRWSSAVEALRCSAVMAAMLYLPAPSGVPAGVGLVILGVFSVSAILWTLLTVTQYKFHVTAKKIK